MHKTLSKRKIEGKSSSSSKDQNTSPVKSIETIYHEDENQKIQNRMKFIFSKFNQMGMINSYMIDANSFKAFTLQQILKTVIEIFTDAIENSQATNFNIINYLVNYVYQKVESKSMTSQFCWSLIDQMGLEAENNLELRLILQLIEENSYDSIEFYVHFRKIIYQYLFNQEKSKCGYESFYLDEFSVICEQWIILNQRVFQTVTNQEMMEFFLDQIKNVRTQQEFDAFYKLQCSEYMKIAIQFHKYILNKYEKYEKKMEIYHKNQILLGLKVNRQPELQNILKGSARDKNKFGKSFYRWGWPFFSKEDFERDILLSQQRMQNQPSFQNLSQFIENKKPSQTSRKQTSKSRKSIMITPERSKSSNQLKLSQTKQQQSINQNDSFTKTPQRMRQSISSNKGKINYTAPSSKNIFITPPNNYDLNKSRDNNYTPNRNVSPFLETKSIQKPSPNNSSGQKNTQFSKSPNQYTHQDHNYQYSNHKSYY